MGAYPDTMLVLGTLLAAVAVPCAAILRISMLRHPPESLLIENHRGKRVPALGGIVILATSLLTETVLTLVATIRPGPQGGPVTASSAASIPAAFMSSDHLVFLIVLFGFFLLGTIDDLAGAGQAKGFRGHVAKLKQGIVTGGAIKAVGGFAVAFVASGVWEMRLFPALADAGVIALTANLLNLLDLRPGRAVKVFLLAWVPLAATGWSMPYFALSFPVVASAVTWLPADLKEEAMLGDAGANTIGALIGLGIVLLAPISVRLTVLAGLVALTLVSEKWSFTRLIEVTPALNWFDRLGRVRE
ncbi:MAG: hypothetical protein LC723_03300 [Actinobacteria bacterium]|nr:hypothetical protein [Actinomycetota bacterium]